MKTEFLIPSLCLLMTACSPSDKSAPQSNLNPLTQDSGQEASQFIVMDLGRPVSLDERLNNIHEFSERINETNLRINAVNGTLKGGSVICFKELSGTLLDSTSGSFDASGTTAVLNLKLNPSDKNNLRFDCSVLNSTKSTIHRFSHNMLKSFVVDRVMNINELAAVDMDTLVIMNKGELVTEGQSIDLRIKTLVSDAGEISTFTYRQTQETPDQMDGKSGGLIKIKALDSIGTLRINLRGTNGGKQTFIPQRPERRAERGQAGNCRISCDGGVGPKGHPAVNGRNGYMGGDSGYAMISLENKSDFEIIFNYAPGKGSAGTKASLPGLGGFGGAADSYIETGSGDRYTVVAGQPGGEGPLGDAGMDGINGNDGEVMTSSYKHVEHGVEEIIRGSWTNTRGYNE
jgi:hypothetical protein